MLLVDGDAQWFRQYLETMLVAASRAFSNCVGSVQQAGVPPIVFDTFHVRTRSATSHQSTVYVGTIVRLLHQRVGRPLEANLGLDKCEVDKLPWVERGHQQAGVQRGIDPCFRCSLFDRFLAVHPPNCVHHQGLWFGGRRRHNVRADWSLCCRCSGQGRPWRAHPVHERILFEQE